MKNQYEADKAKGMRKGDMRKRKGEEKKTERLFLRTY